MREIREQPKRKKRRNYIFIFVVSIFIIYIAALIVDQQVEIANKQYECQQLLEKTAVQKAKNEELKEVINSTEIIKEMVPVPVNNDGDGDTLNNPNTAEDPDTSGDNTVYKEQITYKYNSDYIEQVARQRLGYIMPGEQVFVTVAGN